MPVVYCKQYDSINRLRYFKVTKRGKKPVAVAKVPNPNSVEFCEGKAPKTVAKERGAEIIKRTQPKPETRRNIVIVESSSPSSSSSSPIVFKPKKIDVKMRGNVEPKQITVRRPILKQDKQNPRNLQKVLKQKPKPGQKRSSSPVRPQKKPIPIVEDFINKESEEESEGEESEEEETEQEEEDIVEEIPMRKIRKSPSPSPVIRSPKRRVREYSEEDRPPPIRKINNAFEASPEYNKIERRVESPKYTQFGDNSPEYTQPSQFDRSPEYMTNGDRSPEYTQPNQFGDISPQYVTNNADASPVYNTTTQNNQQKIRSALRRNSPSSTRRREVLGKRGVKFAHDNNDSPGSTDYDDMSDEQIIKEFTRMDSEQISEIDPNSRRLQKLLKQASPHVDVYVNVNTNSLPIYNLENAKIIYTGKDDGHALLTLIESRDYEFGYTDVKYIDFSGAPNISEDVIGELEDLGIFLKFE